jgi:hypothetical protein
MNSKRQLFQTISCIILVLFLAGCAAATSSPTATISPTVTPEPPTQVPATATPAELVKGEVLPTDTPVGFEFLYGLGTYFMLPPSFPAGDGLPAVQPYVITVENGDYDISLDYGPECLGAGACHYGSLSGKKVTSNQPESTLNFVYEADRAQKVTLAKDIEGYFVEGQCGASCDDSKLFWVYKGFQFMIGLKGGTQQDLVDLANAAINNSLK